MIQHVSIQPNQIQGCTKFSVNFSDKFSGFPILLIDTDSYIVGADIQSGINFDVTAGRHHLAIGKGCSLAESITFMIDLNHDYSSIAQGELSFLKGTVHTQKSNRKASIILQNDVWVGHGATIMAGVILHNGCVVAADSVVTKDVPPYAIVGGNPAKILRYRFDPNTIELLQKIAWWDWPKEVQLARKNDFDLPVHLFVEKYYLEETKSSNIASTDLFSQERPIVLFIPDLDEPFPLYPKILDQYFSKDRPETELLIYLPGKDSGLKKQKKIEAILQRYSACDSCVTLQTGVTLDERILFQGANYFVTTRSHQTVQRTCLADIYGVKILYGTDEPIFPLELI